MKSLNIKARLKGKKRPPKQPHPTTAVAAEVHVASDTPPNSGGQEAYLSFLLDNLFGNGLNLEERVITLEGPIENGWFSYVDACFSALELLDKETPITLRINTPGGNVMDGWAIISRMEISPCDVITEGFGQVMSMGTLLLMAGDIRRISRHAVVMVHCSSYGVEDRHGTVKHFVKQAEKEEVKAAKYMAERSKKPAAFWKKTGSVYDAFFTAEEALTLGIVDETF